MVRISVLDPDFTWHTTPTVAEQQRRLEKYQGFPKLRPVKPRWFRVLVGCLHELLVKASHRYCDWMGIQFSGQICDLPFGLVLKRSDGTRLEEVVAMRAARDAGLPVPYVVSYGEHPEAPHAPISILMTRMPGDQLFHELWDWYQPQQKQAFLDQLQSFLDAIRSWRRDPQRTTAASESAGNTFCSIIGTNLRSVRVPNQSIGPCANEKDFDEEVGRFAYAVHAKEMRQYPQLMAQLKEFEQLGENDVVFTHGDLAGHNLLVLPDGRISAMIDWEASGWYPAYWEYTTGLGLLSPDSWWFKIVESLSGNKYQKHYHGDRARRLLASDSMSI